MKKQRFLILGVLLAFVFMGLLAAVPHSHDSSFGHKPHDCSVCRAQSVQPHIESTVSIGPSLQPLCDFVVPCVHPCFSENVTLLPYSRAPPLIA